MDRARSTSWRSMSSIAGKTGKDGSRESVKAVFEHRPNENTLDSTNVKGKL